MITIPTGYHAAATDYPSDTEPTELSAERKQHSQQNCCFNLLGLVLTAAFILCSMSSFAYCDFLSRKVTLGPNYNAISPESSSTHISLMTFNIRYANIFDGMNGWYFRQNHPINLINRYKPTVMGTQEGLHIQLKELHHGLVDGYERYGIPRDRNGEHVQIFYDTKKVIRLDGGNFWLSETPDEPGLVPSWGARNHRLTTWCKFQVQNSQQVFFVFNTHLDNRSKEAQRKGAILINERIRSITEPQDTVFLLGDFNTFREDLPYQYFTTEVEHGFRDAWLNATSKEGNVSYTFHAFKGVNNPKEIGAEVGRHHIDFVLYSPPSIEVTKTEVITEGRKGCCIKKLYPSDHFPVLTHVVLP